MRLKAKSFVNQNNVNSDDWIEILMLLATVAAFAITVRL
jgi:hypothetical protein